MNSERRAHEAELRLLMPEEGVRTTTTVVGYAAVFNSLSNTLGSGARRFRERIMPGAFRSALDAVAQGQNVFAFYSHGITAAGPNSAMPLASTRDGSLRMVEDPQGLRFELDIPDTSDGRDLAALTKRGTVRGASFAWPVGAVRDTWSQEGGVLVRTIHEVRALLDVSPTHQPAYPDTALAVRSLEAWEQMESRSVNGAGEMSFEQLRDAVWSALRAKIGDPWGPGAEPWSVVATFPTSAVVEKRGLFLSYPVEWRGRDIQLGDPQPVEQVFKPQAAAAGDAERARRLRLLVAEGA